MEQQIRFCTTSDGTRIAYATVGEGPPLVVVPSWRNNMELDRQHPDGCAFLEGLGRNRLLVSYDRRGVGSSQRDVEDISIEAQVADVAAVVDHVHLDRFDLIGYYDGASVGVAYAAQHPEQVSRLVLWAPYPDAAAAVDRGGRALIQLIHENWGLGRRAIANIIFPSGPTDLQRWFSSTMRDSMSPEMAAKSLDLLLSLDVRAELPHAQAPTLVLHRRGDRTVPIAAGRTVAAMIPDARFIGLEGDITMPYFGDTSFLETITRFLDEDRTRKPATEQSAGGLVTLLMTDMEGSTSLTQRLGDAKAQDILRTHNSIVRDALKATSGSEIKHTGDGIMASFPSASRALEAAVAIQKALAGHNQDNADTPIRVRIGLNAGEPVAEDDDLFGTAVQLAARVCAQAEPGQILASNVVQELAAGKGFDFADKGEAELKGFEKPVRLHEVRWLD